MGNFLPWQNISRDGDVMWQKHSAIPLQPRPRNSHVLQMPHGVRYQFYNSQITILVQLSCDIVLYIA
jgi:hypothetical protein